MSTPMSSSPEAIQQATETMDILYELSQLLNTGLDRQTLSVLAALCECGINPEALANAIKELSQQRTQ